MSEFQLILNGGNYDKFISEGFQKWGWIVNRTSGLSAILRCLVGYLLGISSYLIFKDKQLKFSSLRVVLITSILICLLFIEKSDFFFLLLMPILLYFLTEKSMVSNLLSSKIVYFLGEISYSLYMVHLIIIWRVIPYINFILLKKFSFNHLYFILLDFIISMFLSILISTITYRVIEKPLNKKLRSFLLVKKTYINNESTI